MAGMRPTITATGLKEATRDCKQSAANLRGTNGNMRKVLKVFATDILTLMSDSFRNQADPRGDKWAPLAESTILSRVSQKAGYKAGRYNKYTRRGYTMRTEKSAGQRAAETRRKRYASMGRRNVYTRMGHTMVLKKEGAKYKEKYAAKVEAFRAGMKILDHNHGLAGRLVSRVEGTHSIVFGSGVSYGIYHQTGTENMPRRMWAPVQEIVKNSGRWMTIRTGPAGALWDRMAKKILNLAFSTERV